MQSVNIEPTQSLIEVDKLNAQLEFIINGILILVISILGIFGNIICIFMICRRKSALNPTFSNLLSWLAVIDSTFLVLMILVFSLPQISQDYSIWTYPYLLPTLLPLTSISLTGSVYCTVALALERYFSITKSKHSNKGSFFGYMLPVIVFSIFYNFPKFFEFATYFKDTDDGVLPYFETTAFRQNSDYSVYVLGSNFIFMAVIPFATLISLNIVILRHARNCITYPERVETTKLTFLLSSLVVVQLISHTPRTVLNLLEIYSALTENDLLPSQTFWVDLSHLLLVVSCSLNVIIYSLQDIKFHSLMLPDIRSVLKMYKKSANVTVKVITTKNDDAIAPSRVDVATRHLLEDHRIA